VLDRNSANLPWYVLGTQTQYTTRQDHLKAKLAYELTPAIRATYVAALWQNEAKGESASYLRDAAGGQVTSGTVNVDGRSFAPLNGGDFPVTRESLTHVMQGLSVKQHTHGVFDWELAGSRYDYREDSKRQNAAGNPLPSAVLGGAGTIADGSGTGWRTLSARGTWRPAALAHIADFGVQQDSYRLQYATSLIAGNWLADAAGPLASDVEGRTRLRSLWAQDTWALGERWKLVLGARAEWWKASSGLTRILTATPPIDTRWPTRSESHISPKAALSWQWLPGTVVKLSAGRAVRFPTVAELYGATSTTNSQFINDPNLRPERSWTRELSLEKDLGSSQLRVTGFSEDTRDALYSQSVFDAVANRSVARVQNVGHIRTLGVEVAWSGFDVAAKGLDVNASATYADSRILENAGFVSVPGDTVGKRQPNIPRLRASALVSYRWSDHWSTSAGARYSGRQFRLLDNTDVNGFAYMGVSRFFVVDLRARYRFDAHWSAAVGIDNVNNDKYWNFHPYPQRTFVAELKADL
jgi:iron complex outermembrane recepter protein